MASADEIKRHHFPEKFMFGVGSSAFQIEGRWNADGKGLSVWDCFTLRNPDKCVGQANATVANDAYSRIKEDVQVMKKMGITSYRFSISWPRILPGGRLCMGKNMEGINHYNQLIDELLANGIEPFVTLFHWDLPNALEEEYMGFLSSRIIADFGDYADVCFWEFGDRVKYWSTFNEPFAMAFYGYGKGWMPPCRGGENEDGDPETEPYTVAYNILNCHATAYRKYEDDYKESQKGKVGITLNSLYFKPYRENNQEDHNAVEYGFDFMFGWFMQPLTSGTWPKSILEFAVTPTPKYPKGRVLNLFNPDQRKKLIGSYDFLGLNYYNSNFAQYQAPSEKIPLGIQTDRHYTTSGQDSEGNYIGKPVYPGASSYLCPQGLTDLLHHISKKYNISKEIFITENGFPEVNDPYKSYGEVKDDTGRIDFIAQHLKAIKEARDKFKVNVMAYYVWSFMDSCEWSNGYSARYGMIYVDFKNNLLRYPKKSALWYKKFISEEKKVHLKRSVTDRDENEMDHEEQTIDVMSKKLRKTIA